MKADDGTARRFLIAGAAGLPVGVALAVMRHAGGSAVVTLVAIAALAFGLHTFGRAGPDPGA